VRVILRSLVIVDMLASSPLDGEFTSDVSYSLIVIPFAYSL